MTPFIMTNPPDLVQKGTDYNKYGEKEKDKAVTDIFPSFLFNERQQQIHEEVQRLAHCYQYSESVGRYYKSFYHVDKQSSVRSLNL